jgi:hypothetical protein
MADLNRALKLMKALDLEQLERQDQIEMQEVISILESLPPDQMTSEDEKQDALQALHEAEQMADVDATQEDGFVPHGEETTEAVEVEPDSSEVTVDSVMEEKLEEATKEALKDEPK